MSKFWQRFKLFLIGIFLGVLLVYFMLIRGRDRDLMGWLPAKRVLAELQEKQLHSTSKGNCYLTCYSMNQQEVEAFIEDAGVSFSKSNPRKKPPVYVVVNEIKERQLEIYFEMQQDTAYLVKIDSEPPEICNCD